MNNIETNLPVMAAELKIELGTRLIQNPWNLSTWRGFIEANAIWRELNSLGWIDAYWQFPYLLSPLFLVLAALVFVSVAAYFRMSLEWIGVLALSLLGTSAMILDSQRSALFLSRPAALYWLPTKMSHKIIDLPVGSFILHCNTQPFHRPYGDIPCAHFGTQSGYLFFEQN